MGCFPFFSDETNDAAPFGDPGVRFGRPGSQHGFIQFLVAPLVFGTATGSQGGGEGFLLVEDFLGLRER